MVRHPRRPPAVVPQRTFEASRLAPQWLAAAYVLAVPDNRRRVAPGPAGPPVARPSDRQAARLASGG
jgi:hypothetical protein